jgi:hypothetical protein
MSEQIKAPFGAVDTQVLTVAATQVLTITDQYTFIDGVTVIGLTNNRTLNLTIDPGVKKGAKIYLEVATTGTETTIAGTGMTFVTIVGVAGKTKVVELVYDGTTFKPTGTPVQIN